jgi:Fe-S oxidoreductase
MDLLKDYLYTMVSCNHCGQCKWLLGPKMRGWKYAEVCPIHSRYHFDAHSGQGLINIAQELLEGELKYEEGLIEHIYHCTTCGACDVNCKSVRDMEVLDTILALRAKCVEDGKGPMPQHREYAGHVERDHNIFGRPHKERFDWLARDAQVSQDATLVYFAGCATSYMYPEIARDTVKILNAAGIAFRVMPEEEFCCGALLWRTGQREACERVARRNIETLRRHGIKTLVTSCAECYGTFRGFYPRIAELDFEVLHISEIMERALGEGRLKLRNSLPLKVTYHDPCLLGRLSELYVPWSGHIKAFGYHDPPKQWRRGSKGVYEAPRKVLNNISGVTLTEMTRNEENAFCCGGGGGVPDAFSEFALWVSAERVGEALSTEAQAIVSCCPFCQSNFEKALRAGKNSSIRYYDLTGLVSSAL